MASWALLGPLVLTFFAFVAHLKSSWPFVSILFDFCSFLGWFWGGLEGFGEDFSNIFRSFLKNDDFVKYSVFPRKNHYFSHVRLLKHDQKSTKNR